MRFNNSLQIWFQFFVKAVEKESEFMDSEQFETSYENTILYFVKLQIRNGFTIYALMHHSNQIYDK